jgi:uncharacterized protein YneF (UPF0154 family)
MENTRFVNLISSITENKNRIEKENMKNDTQEDDVESKTLRKILSKLENLEKRMKQIEESFKKADETTPLVNEDQLFFGLVLSLALLLVTLPDFDVAIMVESFFGIPAIITNFSERTILIGSLIVAGGFRYYVTLARENHKSKLRAISVLFLLFPIYWLITELFNRGLGAVLLNENVFLIFLSPVAIIISTLLLGKFIERKWYDKYGIYRPFLSYLFVTYGFIMLLAYSLAGILSTFLSPSPLAISLILIVSIIVPSLIAGIMLGISYRKERKHKQDLKRQKS